MGKYFLLLCILLKGFNYLFIYLIGVFTPQSVMTPDHHDEVRGSSVWSLDHVCANCPDARKKKEKEKKSGWFLTPGTASPVGRALSSLTTASFSNCGGTDLCSSFFFSLTPDRAPVAPPRTAKKRNFKVKRAGKNGTVRGADTTGLDQINRSGLFLFFVFCF